MLTRLLIEKKINQYQFDIYSVYRMSEPGRRLYTGMVKEALMLESPSHTGASFGYYAGKKSWIGNLMQALEEIDGLIKQQGELSNDDREQDADQ